MLFYFLVLEDGREDETDELFASPSDHDDNDASNWSGQTIF